MMRIVQGLCVSCQTGILTVVQCVHVKVRQMRECIPNLFLQVKRPEGHNANWYTKFSPHNVSSHWRVPSPSPLGCYSLYIAATISFNTHCSTVAARGW